MSLCVTFLLLLVVGSAVSTNSSHFVQEEMCDVEESINQGCSIEVHGARSSIECTILCWRDTECVGASLDAHGRCFHHQLCHTSVPCPRPDVSTHRYMARYCVHGTWDSSTHSCVCHYGTFGERCNQYHTFCDGLLHDDYPFGVHQVILDPQGSGTQLIKVHCWKESPTYTNLWLMKNSGEIDFNRTWYDYVNGFSVDDDNIWTGLRAAHILGLGGVRNLVVVVEFTNGRNVYADFSDFVFANEGEGFSISYDSLYTASTGDVPFGFTSSNCLSGLQGVPFSTWDRDQDGSVGENCASLAGSGWWYNGDNCDIPCNLLGWGLDNYEATPNRQRLTYVGADVSLDPLVIRNTYMYLVK